MLRLLANVDLLLATILVVNNLVNICIVILTAGIIDSVFTFLRFEFLFKTVLVTFLLLLFGEILPKDDSPALRLDGGPSAAGAAVGFLSALLCAGPHEQPHQ